MDHLLLVREISAAPPFSEDQPMFLQPENCGSLDKSKDAGLQKVKSKDAFMMMSATPSS